MCRRLVMLSLAVIFKCGWLDFTEQQLDEFIEILTGYGVIGTIYERRNTHVMQRVLPGFVFF